jgi:Tol biopolymer transport system component
MTTSHDFERQLGTWLREDSAHRVPEHLTDVLVRTAATGQRRWWLSWQRWLPVDVTVSRAPLVSARTVRLGFVVVALGLLIVTLLILAGGSQRRLPPPFGLARNGTFVTGTNGDLFTVDPRTGVKTPLGVQSPDEFDFGPGFSRDGTKLSFLRVVPSDRVELVVANPDGTDQIVETPAVQGLDQADWSPDGSRTVFLSRVDGRGRINIVNSDGTGLHTLDLPLSANQLSWLPPDGHAILFRREHLADADGPAAIMTVAPDGSGLRVIATPAAANENDLNDVSASPDGTRIVYRESPGNGSFRIHILTLATGRNLVLPEPADSTGQTSPGFSPDGTRVVYLRFYPAGLWLVVAPADGSTTGTLLPLRGQIGEDGPTINNYFFTPDGSAIVANDLRTRITWLLPVDGSPGTVLAQGVAAYDALTAVQRLAP